MSGLREAYMASAANSTLSNISLYGCGLPRDDSFHIFRDVSADIPFTGALIGLTFLGIYTWSNDQVNIT